MLCVPCYVLYEEMVIFIHGQDTYRSRQYLSKLKNKFLKEVDATGDSLNIINGAVCNIGDISNAAQGASLFVRKRMVIVEDLFVNKKETIFKQVFDFLTKNEKTQNQDDNIIIFWDSLGENERINKAKKDLFNFLIKTKYSPKPFKKLTNFEVVNWIKNEVAKEDLNMDQKTALLLAGFVDNDLWQASNELNKLINYKKGLGVSFIDTEDVRKMVAIRNDDNIFALTDAIVNNNKSIALKLLEEQIEAGQNELQILNLVARQFKILARVKEQSEAGNNNSRSIASALKLHPYVAQKSLAQAQNYSLVNIKDILNQLVQIDCGFKKGQRNIKMELEMIVVG